jgi:hypothetical protein
MRRAVVLLVSLLVGLMASAAAAQTLRYADGLALYDATGKRVGAAHWDLPNQDYVEVLFRAPSGRTLVLGAVRQGFFGSSDVWFTTVNCTGQAFLREQNYQGSLSIYPATAVVGARQTVYVATVAAGQGRPRLLSSTRRSNGSCSRASAEVWTLPATIEVHLVDYFTPPFALRGSGAAVPP